MKKLLRICILLLLSYQLVAQDKSIIDSLTNILPNERGTERIEILVELFIENLYHDAQKAKEHLDEIQSIAGEIELPFYQAYGYNIEGTYYNTISEYNKSLQAFLKAKQLFISLNEEENLSAILNNISGAYRSLGNLDSSMANQIKSLEIKERIGVPKWDLAASYFSLGNLYGDIVDYDNANLWYRKSLQLYNEIDPGGYDGNTTIYNIGSNLYHMDSLSSARELIDSTRRFFQQNNYPNDLAGSLDMLGNIASKNGDLAEAESNYLLALDIAESNGEKSLPGILYRRIANINKRQNNLDKALIYAERALNNAKETNVRKKMVGDYQVLSEIHDLAGNHKNALAYLKQYTALRDSVLGTEKINVIKDLQLAYERGKQEKEIQLLAEREKRTKLQRNGLIAGVLGLILLLLLSIYALKERIKINKLEKERFDMELSFKEKELSSYALHLASKNETLKKLKVELGEVRKTFKEGKKEIDRIGRQIEFNLDQDSSWDQFKKRFKAVYPNFEKNVMTKYPLITANDLRMMSLIKMNLSSKEIANILNLSAEGVKKSRYRIRKKLNLETGQNLNDLVFQI